MNEVVLTAPPPHVASVRRVRDAHMDDLLNMAIDRRASDLHITAGVPPMLRVDGELEPMLDFQPIGGTESQSIVYDIMTADQIQRFETSLEIDFSYAMGQRARVRVNVYRDRGTVAATLRLIPARIPHLDELGLPSVLREMARKPRGLILVTGPTGSGKSTTLAAMIHQINSERNVHIITIEDPIEYLHHHRKSIINQRELGQDTRSFDNALRAALREDPDVILVGEMRDLETIATAITCAETGHLVLATLHTNSASQTVDRMVDVFPPGQQDQIRYQLASNLEAVLCQQLLPRADGKGRVCAMEVMIATPPVRNMIRDAKTHQLTTIIQTNGDRKSYESSMQTMDQSLKGLVADGIITEEMALSRAVSRTELERMLASMNGKGA
ncbi:MAG TPA: type IV pilus twitching motility protein PilT [Armatimonadota bacterium]